MAEIATSSDFSLRSLGPQRPILARALLLGERIDTHRFDDPEPLARLPLTIRVYEGGVAVLFRYGVVVLLNVSPAGERGLIERIASLIVEPFEPRESDEVRLEIRPDTDDQV